MSQKLLFWGGLTLAAAITGAWIFFGLLAASILGWGWGGHAKMRALDKYETDGPYHAWLAVEKICASLFLALLIVAAGWLYYKSGLNRVFRSSSYEQPIENYRY